MKVIKRDGASVDYDRSKIIIAIEKANAEVSEDDRLSRLLNGKVFHIQNGIALS